MEQDNIQVVVIDDDPMVQEINRQFIERVPGFLVVGVAANGVEGIKLVDELAPDLVVIDVFMPVFDGIKTLMQLRATDRAVDVIVITAAKDTATIQTMLRNGAKDYIIKPFQFNRIKQALENYREFRQQIRRDGMASQDEVDMLLFGKISDPAKDTTEPVRDMAVLPKGLHAVTLEQIVGHLAKESHSLSAEDVAERVGIARVTARRYLDYLEKGGRVRLDVVYGGIGRPTNRYLLVSQQ
ncbi:response regulator [Brevibacillus sp. SIMBA_040]|uniref:response regulator n=1 Tax=unclassified Brevibacillus TaxID=2684853 RepID=UPI00397D5018